jgi:glycosyltransferase involved in cell wall biosynthesis
MKVSVVICTYSFEMYEAFTESVESILEQTYDNIELVLMIDGNDQLYQRVADAYGDIENVQVHVNETNVGLSASRNNALSHVTGDVVALIDDDAVADPEWIAELVSVYQSRDAIAAGGRMIPEWVAGKPRFLPEEFYWLIGVTHRGFADDGDEVRNTFGSNISFKTSVLQELGGFEPAVGRHGDNKLQAHETEFCARMQAEYNRGVVYNADAIVAHKVFAFRTQKRWLAKRAFWQGYSKRALEVLVPETDTDEESAFLSSLLTEFIPQRIRGLVQAPSVPKISQLGWLLLLTGLVGAGYLYGLTKWR